MKKNDLLLLAALVGLGFILTRRDSVLAIGQPTTIGVIGGPTTEVSLGEASQPLQSSVTPIFHLSGAGVPQVVSNTSVGQVRIVRQVRLIPNSSPLNYDKVYLEVSLNYGERLTLTPFSDLDTIADAYVPAGAVING